MEIEDLNQDTSNYVTWMNKSSCVGIIIAFIWHCHPA